MRNPAKILSLSALCLFPGLAKADHTLADAMMFNSDIKNAVNAIQEAAGVTCLTNESEQSMPSVDRVKQVAYCYNPKGEGGVIGQLSVTYKWGPHRSRIPAGNITKILFESAK